MIVLEDYSKTEEYQDFCRRLQTAIDRGDCHVVDMAEVLGRRGKEDDEGKTKGPPKVFDKDGSHTKEYAGFLFWEGETIVIRSRFDKGDEGEGIGWFLRYLLGVSLNTRVFDEMETPSADSALDVLLAILYLQRLKAVLPMGPFRQYRTFQHNDSSPKGRLDIPRHIRLNPLGNGKIAYETREFTADNPVNRLILLARGRLRQRNSALRDYVDGAILGDPGLRTYFQQLGYQLGPNVGRDLTLLHRAARPIAHPYYHAYEALRQASVWIVRRMGLDPFAHEDGATPPVAGMVFPMDWMWEILLKEKVLPQAKRPGHSRNALCPVEGDPRPRYALKPDFLLGKENAVLDAKYKPDWKEAYDSLNKGEEFPNGLRDDLYQVMAYMLAFDTDAGGVLFPYRYTEKEKWPDPWRATITKTRYPFYLIPVPIPDRADLDAKSYNGYKTRMEELLRKQKDKISALLG